MLKGDFSHHHRMGRSGRGGSVVAKPVECFVGQYGERCRFFSVRRNSQLITAVNRAERKQLADKSHKRFIVKAAA